MNLSVFSKESEPNNQYQNHKRRRQVQSPKMFFNSPQPIAMLTNLVLNLYLYTKILHLMITLRRLNRHSARFKEDRKFKLDNLKLIQGLDQDEHKARHQIRVAEEYHLDLIDIDVHDHHVEHENGGTHYLSYISKYRIMINYYE